MNDAEDYENAIVRLMTESRRDPVTGLGNYRRFREYVSNLHELGVGFSVVLFDMTNLKRANESLGHFGADMLLANVGKVIRQSCGDAVFRHGGDEFAVVLPACPTGGAIAVRDRLEEAVGVSSLPRSAAKVTIVGAVCTIVPDMQVDAELNRADRMLEHRKAEWKKQNNQPLR
jgi:diguanylate cyclase (GGDEF)-like protein